PLRTVRVGPQTDVRWVHVSPDGRWLITGSHGTWSKVRYKVWNTETGRLVANLPDTEVAQLHGFSPDGRWIYVSGKENRRLEMESLVKGPVVEDDQAPVAHERVIAGWLSEKTRVGGTFTPEGQLAAFGQGDGSIQLVLTEKDEEVARLYSPEVGRIFPSRF